MPNLIYIHCAMGNVYSLQVHCIYTLCIAMLSNCNVSGSAQPEWLITDFEALKVLLMTNKLNRKNPSYDKEKMRKTGELIDLWVVTSVKSTWKAAREARRSPCWFFSRPSRLGRAFYITRDWHKQRNNHVGIIRDWHKQRYNEVPCLLHHNRLA